MRNPPLILVIDDDRDFRDIMSAKLKAVGFTAETAMNGVEGVKKTTELKPDLVLMDINMPGMSGTDAALTIKQNPETANIKISFLTNAANPWPGLTGDKSAITEELGIDKFLEKTQDLKALIEEIKAILAGSEPQGAKPASAPQILQETQMPQAPAAAAAPPPPKEPAPP